MLPLTVRMWLAMGLAAFLVWPAAAVAQTPPPPSLAELARKEAERRKTTKDAKRVITSKDMPESARKGASSAPAGATAAPAGGQKPAADTATADPSGGEAQWRGRITQAREGLRRNEVFLQALQTRVNVLSRDIQNAGSFERLKVVQDQKQALDETEKLKADIEASKKQIADIEEEARKAGVPPGWLR